MKSTDSPAFLFDLDGTLIDSVYLHISAWQEAFQKRGFDIPAWNIHRRIGMSGEVFVHALFQETGYRFSKAEGKRLQKLHGNAYKKLMHRIRPLPGARELLRYLVKCNIPWAIATSGEMSATRPALKVLGVPKAAIVITGDSVGNTKPAPDLFRTAAGKLGKDMRETIVVGDSIWDLLAARRSQAFGVGLLSGGYGADELNKAGACRVYNDPANLLRHLDEVGIHTGR